MTDQSTRPPSLVDREALDIIRKSISGALIIAESEWVFDGAHPMRGVALENLRKADAILSLVNPQDKGVGCETMESQCNSIVPSGHVGVEYTASKGLSRVDCWVTREEGERIRNSSSVTIALRNANGEVICLRHTAESTERW